jgi:hypothetical protein
MVPTTLPRFSAGKEYPSKGHRHQRCRGRQLSFVSPVGVDPLNYITQMQFGTELGYILETAAHWIASYFREDTFLHLPTIPEALEDTQRNGAWLRKRFPESLHWVNESYSGFCSFFK